MSLQQTPTSSTPTPAGAGGSPAAYVPSSNPNRFSLEGIHNNKRLTAMSGAVFFLIALVIIVAILFAFTGRFTDVRILHGELPQGSNAVPVGAAIQYRQVTVGKVVGESPSPSGSVRVKMAFYPARMAQVPRGVEAQISPLSIFGNQFVNLCLPVPNGCAGQADVAIVPTRFNGSDHLQAGDFINAYHAAPSTSLQSSITQLYKLLNAVKPAQLDIALSAFATALNGEGNDLGQSLKDASTYINGIQPTLPTLEQDLRLLDPASHHLSASSPDVLATLGNLTTTGNTINSQSAMVRSLLRNSNQAIGSFSGVLTQSESSLVALLNQSGTLLETAARNPNELSATISGLAQFAAAVAAAEAKGPFISIAATLPLKDSNAAVNAALGYNNPASLLAALGSAANPTPYSSADCPVYGTETSHCGGGSPAAAPVQAASLPAGGTATHAASATASARTANATSAQAPAAATPTAAEQQAIAMIIAALNGGQDPAASGTGSLLLFPILNSMTSGG